MGQRRAAPACKDGQGSDGKMTASGSPGYARLLKRQQRLDRRRLALLGLLLLLLALALAPVKSGYGPIAG